ncbi:MAG: hypothetical protein GY784_18865 [Gammaproteobacteria bacterium]|nr:hypothetical protein [Gammaproteobacteria bacterium]
MNGALNFRHKPEIAFTAMTKMTMRCQMCRCGTLPGSEKRLTKIGEGDVDHNQRERGK